MPGTRVFVGGLKNPRVRERDLEKFFEGFGRIDDIVLKQGFGFVVFKDDRDAKDACDELDGKSMSGDRLTVELARGSGGGGGRGSDRGRFGGGGGRFGGRGGFGRDRDGGYGGRDNRRGGRAPVRTDYRLIVENLSSSVSWQDLKDYMRKAGEVNYADAHRQKQNEGVIEFVHRDGMKKALETLNNTELNGRKIKLIEDKGSRRSRSRSRSDSRSKSRSESRSRSRSESRSRSRSKSKSPASKEKKEGKSR